MMSHLGCPFHSKDRDALYQNKDKNEGLGIRCSRNFTSRSICQQSLRDARGEGAVVERAQGRSRDSRDNSKAAIAEDKRENKRIREKSVIPK